MKPTETGFNNIATPAAQTHAAVQTNSIIQTNPNEQVNLTEYSIWLADRMVGKTYPLLQYLIHSANLNPEQTDAVNKVYLHELKMMSSIHNISVICENQAADKVVFANYDVKHFLNSIIRQTLRFFAGSNITFDVECHKRCAHAAFDVKLLGFVMFNLISNTILHARRREKKVVITAAISCGNLVISYKDNGNGISKAKRRTLFNFDKNTIPREHIAKTGALSPLGLGLKASYVAMRNMGGTIECLPGAEFLITIPQKDDPLSLYEVCEPEFDPEMVLRIFASSLLHESGEE